MSFVFDSGDYGVHPGKTCVAGGPPGCGIVAAREETS
jgi:hypothetical protein